MKDTTILTVNWNQQPCVELLLKSFIKHHYCGEQFNLMLVDNDSTDNSKEWLVENDVPFVAMPKNLGHEQAINEIYGLLNTRYVLLLDTDVEFKSSIFRYFKRLVWNCISAGELIDNQYMNQDKVKDRVSPWFWLFDIKAMKERGVNTFRTKEDWSYDVGSEYWEKMSELGFVNYNIERFPGNQDQDIVSMKYETHDHIGKVSWNIYEKHQDRIDEVQRRRNYVHERLELYKDIDLRNKFTL